MRIGMLAAVLSGCTDKTTGDSGETTTAAIECEVDWIDVNGIVVEPIVCLGWSPRSADPMTWHEAISANETTHSDDDATDYCASLSFGGRDDWRLPDAGTLEYLSTHAPPLDEPDGDLWSSSTDTVATDLAWTIDLSNPGISILLGKDSDAYVRCIVGE